MRHRWEASRLEGQVLQLSIALQRNVGLQDLTLDPLLDPSGQRNAPANSSARRRISSRS